MAVVQTTALERLATPDPEPLPKGLDSLSLALQGVVGRRKELQKPLLAEA